MDKQSILDTISKQLDLMQDYGQLQFFVKKHRGQFSNTDFLHITSQKFTDLEPNVTAASQMLQMLKGATFSAKQFGKDTTLGFSVVIDGQGNAKTMQVQDFKKV